MYIRAWIKYVPVLYILFKKAIAMEQVLQLEVADFKHAGATRKSGYKFDILFVGGRPMSLPGDDISKSFVATLLENKKINELLHMQDYVVSMNNKFQLSIRYVPKQETLEDELSMSQDNG